MKKSTVFLAILGMATLFFATRCNSPIVVGNTVIIPQSFPGDSITGITFPTDSHTINGWVNNPAFAGYYDSASIYKHAWGIWAGLTATTTQSVTKADGNLLVFETWMGLNEVRDYIVAGLPCSSGELKKTNRPMLTRPTQFGHAGNLATTINQLPKLNSKDTVLPTDLWVTVSYNPEQACHAINNKLFKQSVLNSYYNASAVGSVPQFPAASISIKPTYLEFPASATILKMPVWLNPPNPPGALSVFQPAQFPLCVFVDVKNRQQAGRNLVPVTVNCTNPDSIANATCNLSDFINFAIDSTMAAFMNAQDSVQGMNNTTNGYGKAEPGNRVLLVAMHVTTKETTNWTWQTYYWTPTPATPGAPSSNLAASLITPQVKGAARHYALNAAYVMTTPNNSSAANAGPMFGYNPYLEGGFGPSTFNISNTTFPDFKYGMQTNCMSCHALAVPSNATGYNTDMYVDMNSPTFFNGQVKLDFAWSIQTALINDTIPYWSFK